MFLVAILLIFGFSLGVEIVSEEKVPINLEKQKVKFLKSGFIILEYPDYQLVIDVKKSQEKVVHLKCSLDMFPFLQSCGRDFFDKKLRAFLKIPSNIYLNVVYYRLNKDRFGICTEQGIYIYEKDKFVPVIEYKFPAFIQVPDCSFSSDGRFAVYLYGKNYFSLLKDIILLGKNEGSNFKLVEINIQKRKKKTLLESYKFFPFYRPVYSEDNNVIYFHTDRTKSIKDKGLYSYHKKSHKVVYETFFTAPIIYAIDNEKLLICDIRDIYLYSPKTKKKLLVYSLKDKECPQFIYYVEELNVN